MRTATDTEDASMQQNLSRRRVGRALVELACQRSDGERSPKNCCSSTTGRRGERRG